MAPVWAVVVTRHRSHGVSSLGTGTGRGCINTPRCIILQVTRRTVH